MEATGRIGAGKRRAGLLAAAALSGAAGLGTETLLLSSAGLALGYGRGVALGLGAWFAGWAIGAWFGGLIRTGAARALLVAGIVAGALAGLSVILLLAAGGAAVSETAATALGLLAIFVAALPQGFFLPLLDRLWSPAEGGARDVSLLYAASLAGGALGAIWIGTSLAGAYGRPTAAWCAGACALAAGVLGAMLGRRARGANGTQSEARTDPPDSIAPALAGLVIGLGTAWSIALQWIGLRLAVLWLGGMQPTLTAVLVAALLAFAAGAAVLPRLVPHGRRGIGAVLLLALVGSAWPLLPFHAVVVAAFDAPFARALFLVGPGVFALGALVPVVHRATRGESSRRLGGMLLHESWGALLGAPLVQWILVPRLGLGGTLAVLGAVMSLLLPLFLARKSHARWTVRPALLALLLVTLFLIPGLRATQPALVSPKLADPAFRVISFTEDAHFAVTVVQDGVLGERTLLTDDFRATGTGEDYLYMRVLGHLPVLLHPDPRRTCVLAFGTGTTAGAVALHPEVERIDVLELSRAVCEQAQFFFEVNHGVYDEGPWLAGESDPDARVALHLGDGRRTLARHPGAFDVITMEPLLPDSPFAVYLYTAEFYARAKSALAPGGLLCQWVPPHALEPATFDAVIDAFTRAFPWSGVFLFGTQVILIGGEREPTLSAARFPPEESELHAALAALGLDGPDGVIARFVTNGARWPTSARPLTDADPWVVYARRRRGRAVLADLPDNLRTLRLLEEDPPIAWRTASDASALRRLDGARLLHRAREAWEAERAGLPPSRDESLDSADSYRAALREGFADDPEVQVFERLARFDAARTSGVVALGAGQDGIALQLLLEAAALRPRRGDVHLFVAVAAERLGQPELALKAAMRALRLCPRVDETPQGGVALRLGLSRALVERARRDASLLARMRMME